MDINLESKLAVLNALTTQELELEYTRVIGEIPPQDRAAMIDRMLTAPRRTPETEEED